MVQELSTQFVSEELYNLIQLAEVTLAAGRLSTTNVHTEESNYPNNIIRNEFVDYESDKFNKIPVLNEKQIYYTDNFLKNISNPKKEFFNIPNFMGNNNKSTNDGQVDHVYPFSSSDEDCSYYTNNNKTIDKTKIRQTSISRNNTQNNKQLRDGEYISNHSPSEHLSKDTEISYYDDHVCPECGKKYSTSSNLARHRQIHRSILDKKARQCPHCEKVYVSIPAYSMHVRTHSQGCKCLYCGKCFSRPWLLQGHIRTHTGEKPFKCNICSKAFADKSNLRAHTQTHSKIKPHSCKRCGKGFALKSYLYKHEESSCMRNYLKSTKGYEKRRNIAQTRISLLSRIPNENGFVKKSCDN